MMVPDCKHVCCSLCISDSNPSAFVFDSFLSNRLIIKGIMLIDLNVAMDESKGPEHRIHAVPGLAAYYSQVTLVPNDTAWSKRKVVFVLLFSNLCCIGIKPSTS